jgi:TetR/AcrR family transcriptional repressor of nem operon
MGRPSLREKILAEGLKVVHERGFAAASVRDIVRAAGVPQGSFTNHFASKEAFGLEILNLYFAESRRLMDETLRNDARPPLQRLSDFLDAAATQNGDDCGKGCLVGNFSAEVAEHSDALRARLVAIFGEVRDALAYCLRAAVEAGELPRDFDVPGVAAFIQASLQGVTLVAKAERDRAAVARFRDMLFRTVLRAA